MADGTDAATEASQALWPTVRTSVAWLDAAAELCDAAGAG